MKEDEVTCCEVISSSFRFLEKLDQFFKSFYEC